MSSSHLLRHSIPLVSKHGFTRTTIALGSIPLFGSQLSETAISSMFGHGDGASRALLRAWLAEGIIEMRKAAQATDNKDIKFLLRQRLDWNKPALPHLSQALTLLFRNHAGIVPLDLYTPLTHSVRVADEACTIAFPSVTGTAWYSKRAEIASVYTAAELHQLISPSTAPGFLDELLSQSSNVNAAIEELSTYGDYIWRSWRSILKSYGGV